MPWNQGDHPRGQGGRFASKGGAITNGKSAIKSMIPKDSYTKQDDYKSTLKRFRAARESSQKARSQYVKINDQMEKYCPVLPYEQWSKQDKEYSQMLGKKDFIRMGFAPRKNPQKYDQMKKRQRQLFEQMQEHDAEQSLARSQLDWIKEQQHQRQVENWISPTDLKKYDGEDIPGFDTSTTGVPYYDDLMKSGKGIIVTMSPKSYLEYCAYKVFQNGTIESTVNAVSAQNADKYAEQMRSGTKFDMPYLNLRERQQEGRHRAVAAMINGQEKIPVFVLTARG